jgi:ABC-type branched-subunit amino acid transport system substrate-binding protein
MAPFDNLSQLEKLLDNTRLSLDFYNGILVALETEQFPGIKKVEIRTFDTRKDPVVTGNILRDSVKPFKPDVIIGSLFTKPSAVIAEWAAENNVLQIVPFSPAASIVQNKPNSFLATPSVKTQAQKLGEYLYKQGHRTYALVSDGSGVSDALTDALARFLADSGTTVIRRFVSSTGTLDAVLSELRLSPPNVLYFPATRADLINHLLIQRYTDSLALKPTLVGLQDWPEMPNLDLDLLSREGVIFPATFFEENDLAKLEQFQAAYAQRFGLAPSQEARQGFDVIRMVLEAYGSIPDPTTPVKALHLAKPFKGINQNYFFGTQHDNQSVLILQYTHNKLHKLKTW